MKSAQLNKAPAFVRVATDHRAPETGSPGEAIDPLSVSRSVVSAWAEQIRPLLLDPAIIAEPADSPPEAVSHTFESSKALPQRAVSNFDPDGQEHSGPSLYQPQWQTNSEIENLDRFTLSGREATSIPSSINDISYIDIPFDSDFVSHSYQSGAAGGADGWTQDGLSRFTGLQENRGDVSDAEVPLGNSARATGLEPLSATDPPEWGLTDVSLLFAGLQNEDQGQVRDEGQDRALSSPGTLFPWANGGADGLFAATVSPSIPRADRFEMGREADTLASGLRSTTSPMPETRNGNADQPWQSRSGQDAEESESLGNLTARLTAVAERLEQAALRLASQAPPLAAPRPFQGRVGA